MYEFCYHHHHHHNHHQYQSLLVMWLNNDSDHHIIIIIIPFILVHFEPSALRPKVFVVHAGLPGPDPRLPFNDAGGKGTGYDAMVDSGRRGGGQNLSLLGHLPDMDTYVSFKCQVLTFFSKSPCSFFLCICFQNKIRQLFAFSQQAQNKDWLANPYRDIRLKL